MYKVDVSIYLIHIKVSLSLSFELFNIHKIFI